MKSYGRISGVSMSILGASTLGFSLLYSFMTSNFDFFVVNYAFFAFSIVLMGVATAICFSFKEKILKCKPQLALKRLKILKFLETKRCMHY